MVPILLSSHFPLVYWIKVSFSFSWDWEKEQSCTSQTCVRWGNLSSVFTDLQILYHLFNRLDLVFPTSYFYQSVEGTTSSHHQSKLRFENSQTKTFKFKQWLPGPHLSIGSFCIKSLSTLSQHKAGQHSPLTMERNTLLEHPGGDVWKAKPQGVSFLFFTGTRKMSLSQSLSLTSR